jgi:hypothetical protein
MGRKFFSKLGAKGTGVSKLPSRISGASRYSKQFSEIQAMISPPIPPVRQSSWRKMTFPVFRTVFSTASLSQGKSVRKSKISASAPNSATAAFAQCTPMPYVMMLTEFPSVTSWLCLLPPYSSRPEWIRKSSGKAPCAQSTGRDWGPQWLHSAGLWHRRDWKDRRFLARCMEKPSLVGLGMEGSRSYACTRGHSDDDVGVLAPAVVDFCKVIDDLVEADGDEIGKLHFDHGLVTFDWKVPGRHR